jgi:hypothetical protein
MFKTGVKGKTNCLKKSNAVPQNAEFDSDIKPFK